MCTPNCLENDTTFAFGGRYRAGRVQDAQDHLLHLYEDVRGYAATIRLQPEPCDLADLWRQAWEDLEVQRKGRRAELRERIDGVDRHCRVDPFRLRQVFRNVLENSLAACPDPAVIEVGVAAARVGGRPGLRVAVRDTGSGLTAEQQARLVEPFFTTKTNGTGARHSQYGHQGAGPGRH
jgi:signal transduction histidine kinase